MDEQGRIDLESVLEVVALEALPGDAGPLTFIAFVRGVTPGKRECAFRLHPAGNAEHLTARMPLSIDVPAAYDGRQVVLQARIQSIPVTRGGWFDLILEWEGQDLAQNRFAIGVAG